MADQAPQANNPYQILGVNRYATQDEIRTAYVKLARKYHPDMHPPGATYAEEMFKEVSNAYEALSDAGLRARYDGLASMAAHGISPEKRAEAEAEAARFYAGASAQKTVEWGSRPWATPAPRSSNKMIYVAIATAIVAVAMAIYVISVFHSTSPQEAIVTVKKVAASFTGTAPTEVYSGADFQWRIAITNVSKNDYSNLEIVAGVDGQAEVLSYSPTIPRQSDGSMKIGPVKAGQTVEMTFNLKAMGQGLVHGSAYFYDRSGDTDVEFYSLNGKAIEDGLRFETVVKWRP